MNARKKNQLNPNSLNEMKIQTVSHSTEQIKFKQLLPCSITPTQKSEFLPKIGSAQKETPHKKVLSSSSIKNFSTLQSNKVILEKMHQSDS